MRLVQAVFRGSDDQFAEALALLGMPAGTDVVHRFDPHGVSWGRMAPGTDPWLVALHSWPEHGLVTVDHYGSELVDLSAVLAPLGWVSCGPAPRPPRG